MTDHCKMLEANLQNIFDYLHTCNNPSTCCKWSRLYIYSTEAHTRLRVSYMTCGGTFICGDFRQSSSGCRYYSKVCYATPPPVWSLKTLYSGVTSVLQRKFYPAPHHRRWLFLCAPQRGRYCNESEGGASRFRDFTDLI